MKHIEATPETLRQLGINPRDLKDNEPIETSTINRLCQSGKLSARAQQGAADLARLLNVWESCQSHSNSLIRIDCGNGAILRKEPFDDIPEWAIIEYKDRLVPWKKQHKEIFIENRSRNIRISYFDLSIAVLSANVSIGAIRLKLGVRYERCVKALDKSLSQY